MKWSRGELHSWESALGVLALAVFAFYMMNWAVGAVVHDRKTEMVPDLKGRSVPAALDMLSPIHLGLRKENTEFDSSVPIGSVLRQEPAAGSIVREGQIIRIVVSEGGQTELTPSLAGLPLRNAEMMLRESQLNLGEVSDAYSLRFDKGMVLSQDPPEESSVEKNSLVNVVVSAGLPPSGVTLMPDFQRKAIAQAQTWATGAGIPIQETRDPSSLFPYGVILTQSPAPDTALSAETTVSFVISGRADAGPASGSKMIHYELSQGGSESLVRIVVEDKYGEREIFNGLRKPGSKIDVPVQETGGARIKIYLNGILVSEREL